MSDVESESNEEELMKNLSDGEDMPDGVRPPEPIKEKPDDR